ncbi:LacI family DNA-binding transcriptional regulator [Streptomyces sp. NPDC090741]|uniref:LacI family DNA-binding transcriptional regulator n=1 Tax=Streptomyces sp. NPDC090741 TaxID=3365967 RepID=UPI00381C086A
MWPGHCLINPLTRTRRGPRNPHRRPYDDPAPGPGPTVADIARAAEVSTATVSHALGGTGRVGESTRRRVREVAAALGYSARRGPRTRSSASPSPRTRARPGTAWRSPTSPGCGGLRRPSPGPAARGRVGGQRPRGRHP